MSTYFEKMHPPVWQIFSTVPTNSLSAKWIEHDKPTYCVWNVCSKLTVLVVDGPGKKEEVSKDKVNMQTLTGILLQKASKISIGEY